MLDKRKRVLTVVLAVVLVFSAVGFAGCMEDENNVNTDAYPYMGHNRIAFNHESEPFNNTKVRKALAYSLNVDEIIEAVQGEDLADNTRSPVPEDHPAHNPNLEMYERDTEKARNLLEEAGYSGDPLLETELYVPDDERADEMEVVQEQAAEAGIDLELNTLEWGSYIEAVEAGNAPLSYSGWSGPTAPQGSFNYMKKNSTWAFYSGWYENEEFTNKLDQAIQETDDDTRWDLYHQAQETLVNEDMGCFIMYTQRNPRAYHDSVDIPEESWNSYMGAGPLVVADEWDVSDSDTIEVAQTHEPADFHPIRYSDVYSGYVFLQIFEPLVSTYPDGSVTTNENTVAESYEISDDALTMTFQIKEGIMFHNGEELDAHDVEFTINTMMPHEKEYMGPNENENYTDLYDVEKSQTSPREGDFANVDYVEATDNYTVKIHMKQPDMELLQKEGIEYLNIIPKDYIEENGWDTYGDELIGSGPYEFTHYKEGNEILLEEFEDHRNEVNTPKIIFNFYGEESTAVTALRDGEAHYMSRISPTNYYDLQG